MAKQPQVDLIDAQAKTLRIDTRLPDIPKALRDSFRRSGLQVPTPAAALERALTETLRGPWAMRTTHEVSEQSRLAYRKTERRVKTVHLWLADPNDVARLESLAGAAIALTPDPERRGARRGRMEYSRPLFFRLAGLG